MVQLSCFIGEPTSYYFPPGLTTQQHILLGEPMKFGWWAYDVIFELSWFCKRITHSRVFVKPIERRMPLHYYIIWADENWSRILPQAEILLIHSSFELFWSVRREWGYQGLNLSLTLNQSLNYEITPKKIYKEEIMLEKQARKTWGLSHGC